MSDVQAQLGIVKTNLAKMKRLIGKACKHCEDVYGESCKECLFEEVKAECMEALK